MNPKDGLCKAEKECSTVLTQLSTQGLLLLKGDHQPLLQVWSTSLINSRLKQSNVQLEVPLQLYRNCTIIGLAREKENRSLS